MSSLFHVVETNSVYSPQCFLHKPGVIGVEDEGYGKQILFEELAYAL
jgi:hypothetical protein